MQPHQLALSTALLALKQRLGHVLGDRFSGQVGLSFHVQDGRLTTLKATSKGGRGHGACSPQLVETAIKAMRPLIGDAISTGLADRFYGVVQVSYDFQDGDIVSQSLSTEQIVKITN